MAKEKEKENGIEEPSEEIDYDSFLFNDITYETILTEKFKNRETYTPVNPKMITAFIPGKIKKIYVKKKSRVKEGDMLLVLEAMKMNNRIFSPRKGTIKEVYVTAGLSVAKGALLIEFK